MVEARWYRKKPVVIEAIQFRGPEDEDAVAEFCGGLGTFNVLDPEDRENCDDPEATAEVFDNQHGTWVLVYDGCFIIRGVKGEFYPCRPDIFEQTYEPADREAS